MGFFNRKNKKFEYKPRYYKGDGNPYEIKHKFDQFRGTVGGKRGIKNKILNAVDELNGKKQQVEYNNEVYELDQSKDKSGRITLYIIIILTLIFLFIIDFDLSIFYQE